MRDRLWTSDCVACWEPGVLGKAMRAVPGKSPWGIREGVGQLQSGTSPNPVHQLTNPTIMITPRSRYYYCHHSQATNEGAEVKRVQNLSKLVSHGTGIQAYLAWVSY